MEMSRTDAGFDACKSLTVINDLIPIYGEAFLRYVLAVDDTPLGGSALDNHQREIAEALRNLAFSLGSNDAQFDQYSRLASLGQWHQDRQTSLPNTFRLHCGGPCLRSLAAMTHLSLRSRSSPVTPGHPF
jgi:hypothetical protein